MTTRIQKWGNSLALRLPRGLAEEAHIEEGAEVDLALRRGQLIVRPRRPAAYRLEDLLATVSRENLHDAVETGGPVGREML
jgi:antitoxin MazE